MADRIEGYAIISADGMIADASGHMLGIVTVDDAMEAVLPGAWKRRLPRVFG